MQSVTIRSLSLGSTLKLCASICAAAGLIVGGSGFALSLLGFPVHIFLFELRLTGIAAGLAAIPAMPLAWALVGLLVGLVIHLPLGWILRAVGGLRVSGRLAQA